MLKIPDAAVLRQQGRAAEHEDHRLSQRHEEQRLRRLPPARPAFDPHHPRIPHARCTDSRGSLGAPHPVRPGRREHGHHRCRPARRRAIQVSRRLDRARREGRVAERQADAAAGRRAQHRRHAARLAQRQAISARPDRDRPAQSDGQRLRPAVRPVRACLQRHADPRSVKNNTASNFVLPTTADMPLALGPGNAGSVKILGPRPIGARRTSGTARPTTTTR